MDRGMEKPYVESCMAAAERGEPQALYDLGLIYSTGQGVELDYVTAHKWFNLAAMRGIRRATVDRAELAADMTEEEVARAQKMAREWVSLYGSNVARH
jgi:TPR repeat protein